MQPCIAGTADRLLTGNARMSDFENSLHTLVPGAPPLLDGLTAISWVQLPILGIVRLPAGDWAHHLKKSIKLKNKLYKESKKSPTEANVRQYKNYKCELASQLKREEKRYYQSKILENKSNLRKTWSIIKTVINKNKCSKVSHSFLVHGKNIDDPVTIANTFNDYFINIGPTLASQITECKKDSSFRRFMPQPNLNSMFTDIGKSTGPRSPTSENSGGPMKTVVVPVLLSGKKKSCRD